MQDGTVMGLGSIAQEKPQTLCGRSEEIREQLAKAWVLTEIIVGQPPDAIDEKWAEPASAIECVEQRLEDCKRATRALVSQLARIQQLIGSRE